jgi:hypothetical protein
MKAMLHGNRQAEKGSIAFSIAAHIVVVILVASITFRYPISAFFHEAVPQTEHVQYVEVRPRAVQPAGDGATKADKPKKAVKPAPIFAPMVTPTSLPPIEPVTAATGVIGGTGTGSGGTLGGLGSAVAPSMPDGRIDLKMKTLHVPISMAERNDSAVKAIIMAYRDAEIAAEEGRGRSPKDWTVERNGQKFGLDSQYIYLGKFKVPSAILAALPFNTGGVDGTRIIEARNAAWIRDDILSHSQGMSEDDFNAAVKRIRERKDRERKEAEDAKKAAPKVTPIVP